MSRRTLIIGASDDPSRYAYLAANRLKSNGHEIILLGKHDGIVAGESIHTKPLPFEQVDTVTLYLNPTNQKPYYDYLMALKPKRLIFNPGAENPELAKRAAEHGIETINACTLVMLSANTY